MNSGVLCFGEGILYLKDLFCRLFHYLGRRLLARLGTAGVHGLQTVGVRWWCPVVVPACALERMRESVRRGRVSRSQTR